MEKLWNMKNLPKSHGILFSVMEFCFQSWNFVFSHGILFSVMEFCFQSWNFINFAPKIDQICVSFAATKKLSINVERLHFPTFSAKRCKCKISKRDGHGKLTNGHGKVMGENVV